MWPVVPVPRNLRPEPKPLPGTKEDYVTRALDEYIRTHPVRPSVVVSPGIGPIWFGLGVVLGIALTGTVFTVLM